MMSDDIGKKYDRDTLHLDNLPLWCFDCKQRFRQRCCDEHDDSRCPDCTITCLYIAYLLLIYCENLMI